jgi:hypothetical protein
VTDAAKPNIADLREKSMDAPPALKLHLSSSARQATVLNELLD